MVLVIVTISLWLLTTEVKRGYFESHFCQWEWEAANEVRIKSALTPLLKQILSPYSSVLLNFAVELCSCWTFSSQRGLLRAWIKEFLGWTGAGSCCDWFRSETGGRRETEGAPAESKKASARSSVTVLTIRSHNILFKFCILANCSGQPAWHKPAFN